MLIIIVILSLLSTPSIALLKVGMTEFMKEQLPEIMNFTDQGECAPSFECDIISTVCAYINETCKIIPLPDLDSRFSSIENGEVDLTISINGVSPERSERVHFVRPHYYYSGTIIYVLDTIPQQQHPTWQDLDGKNVCALPDYYAIDGVAFLYGANIIEAGFDAENILNGTCEYFVSSNIQGNEIRFSGLVASAKCSAEFGAPIGIAVHKDEKDGLGAKISEAMVALMNEGEESLILEFEEMNLISAGYPPSEKLFEVVMALTEARGNLSARSEDAIWDA